MKSRSISLDKININEAAQPRVTLDDAYTEEITIELQAGSEFPPVVVFQESQEYWLADGFHRYFAHIKAGLSEIKAEIHPGGMREAILYAVGANATHGKRRSNEDKRKAVLILLKDTEWGQWSDTAIAKKCRVCQPLVGKIRKELTNNGYEWASKRIGADGRKIDISNIGSKSKSEQSGDPLSDEQNGFSQSDVNERTDSEIDESQTSEQDKPEDLSDSEGGNKAKDNNDNSAEEGDSGSYSTEAEKADESTSINSELGKPTHDENQAEQDSLVESGLETSEDNKLVSENETETDANIEASVKPESVDSQLQSVESTDTDDIKTLKAEIVELKMTIAEKDQRILELKEEVSDLQETVKFYEEETADGLKNEDDEFAGIIEL